MARVKRIRRKFKRRVVRKYRRAVRRGAKRGWRSKRTGKKRLTGGLRNKRRIVFAYSCRVECTVPNPNVTPPFGFASFTVQGNDLSNLLVSIGPGIEQPQEFDEWSLFYRLYRVMSSSVDLEIIPLLPGDPSLGPIEILIIPVLGPDNAALAAESFSVTATRPWCKTRIFNTGSDTKVMHFKHFASSKQVCFANSDEVLTDSAFAGTFPVGASAATPPSIQWGFLVKYQYMRFTGTAAAGADFLIRINSKYYTQCEWRVFNAPSGAVN